MNLHKKANKLLTNLNWMAIASNVVWIFGSAIGFMALITVSELKLHLLPYMSNYF